MSQLESTLVRLGVPVPKAIAKASAVRTAVAKFVAAPGADEHALGPSIATGKFSADDAVAAIRAASMARVERGAVTTVYREVVRDFDAADRAALLSAGAEIITALKPIAAAALSKLAAAVEVVGACPDSRSVSHGGPAGPRAFESFREAVGELQSIGVVLGELHSVRYLPCGPADVLCWLAPGANVEAARAAVRSGDGHRQSLLIAAGCDVQLNDAVEQEALIEATAAAAVRSSMPGTPVVSAGAQRTAKSWGDYAAGKVA